MSITTGPERAIRRLLRMEHGVRKAARILLFIDRRQLLEIFAGLPDRIVIQLAREMIRIRLEIPDLQRERERLADELGLLTEVIDLAPPDSQAQGGLDLLDGCDPRLVARLAATLDPASLAAVVCNAATDVAAILIASVGEGPTRHELLDRMSRTQSGRVPAPLLASLRETLARLHAPLTAIQDLPTDPPSSTGAHAFERILAARTDHATLAGLVRTLPTQQLAVALQGVEPALRERVEQLLSARRWADLEAELTWHEQSSPQAVAAARKALARRLAAGLEEADRPGE